MDPDENLKEQLRLANKFVSDGCSDARRLAELILALDKWICDDGGFLPGRWKKKDTRTDF